MVFTLGSALAHLLFATAVAPSPQLCPSVVTALVPQLIFRRPVTDLRRVEIRSCLPGTAEYLQLVAWEQRSPKPSLIVETDDFTVIQVLMRRNIFVIETARGAYDTVNVIVYEGGKPRLALQQTVRDPAIIVTTPDDQVKVTLTPVHAETRSYSFSVTNE